MKLKKCGIVFRPGRNPWESLVTTNPGAWYENKTFYLLYRAAGEDNRHEISFGLATSGDGLHFTPASDEPALAPLPGNFDGGSVEDGRIVKFGDTFFITYACRPHAPGRYWEMGCDEVSLPQASEFYPESYRANRANTALAATRDFKEFIRFGRITHPSLDNRDVILFPEKIAGEYYLLHRPKEWVGGRYGCRYPSIWLTHSKDLLCWDDPGVLLAQGESAWEQKIGGAAPPLRTDKGWLVLYHGVDEKGDYRVGAMLLDLADPSRILGRTKGFIMEPDQPYERDGLYKGGCVFPTGNLIVDGTLYVYYGAGDKYCCLATCPLDSLISSMLAE